jgi:hypothetical protein
MIHTMLACSLVMIGASLATAADTEGDLTPLVPVSQTRLQDLRNYGSGGTMLISPDGGQLISGNNNFLMVFDLTKARLPRDRYNGQQKGVRQIMLEDIYLYNAPLAFMPDGKTLVCASTQGEDPAIQFVDLAKGKVVRQIDNDQPFMGLAVSPDGKYLALGTQQRFEIWDAATGDEIRVFQGEKENPYSYFKALAFSPTGTMIAAAGYGHTVQVFEVATGKERQTFTLPVEGTEGVNHSRRRYYNQNEAPITALAFANDGKVLAVGATDGSVRLVDLMSGEELPPLTGHGMPIASLRFTTDGKSLISLDQEGTKLVWNASRLAAQVPTKLRKLSDAEFEEMWNDLAEADAFRGYRAHRFLAAEGERTLTFLEKHVKPVPAGDAPRLGQLIQDLQGQNASARRKAMTELRKHGEAGLGAILQVGEDQRQTQAMNVMVVKLEKQLASPERQRAIKSVRVLESIGSDGAKSLLDKLSKGAAGARLTTDAKAALERMGKMKE